jgi:hypothetical protein
LEVVCPEQQQVEKKIKLDVLPKGLYFHPCFHFKMTTKLIVIGTAQELLQQADIARIRCCRSRKKCA